jgi:hypothetical protein
MIQRTKAMGREHKVDDIGDLYDLCPLQVCGNLLQPLASLPRDRDIPLLLRNDRRCD